MAVRPKRTTPNLLTAIRTLFGGQSSDENLTLRQLRDSVAQAKKTQSSLFDNKEIQDIVARVSPDTTRLGQRMASEIDVKNVTSVLTKISQRISENQYSNKNIIRMLPEMSQAANIVISSIISPNDLRTSRLSYTTDSKLVDDAQRTKIAEILENYFNDVLHIQDRIPEWLTEMLYGAGAVPLLTIPTQLIKDMINDQSTMTNIRKKDNTFGCESLFGITSVNDELDDELCRSLCISLEAVVTDIRLPTHVEKTEQHEKNRQVRKGDKVVDVRVDVKTTNTFDPNKDLQERMKKFIEATRALDYINVHDNPKILGKAKTLSSVQEFNELTKTKYKNLEVMSLVHGTEKITDYPLYMELPPESVIPVHTPGDSSDHVGYFILLDENGNPASINQMEKNKENNLSSMMSSATINELVGAYGYNNFNFDNLSSPTYKKEHVLHDIYEKIMMGYLQNKLMKGKLENLHIGADNNIMKYIFSQFLKKRQTTLLFVPKSMLAYMCFEHEKETGVGMSSLEDMKYILSIYVALLSAQTMSALENSVDRKKINVNLPKNLDAHSVESLLQMIKNLYISKSIPQISMDPTMMMQSISERSIEIAPRNLPGEQFDDFNIEVEHGQRNVTEVNTDFLDAIKNSAVLGTTVPPSGLNNLNENEYSRSIASSHLFYGNQIFRRQGKAITNFSMFSMNYVSFSRPLIEKIEAILEDGSKKGNSDPIALADGAVVDNRNTDVNIRVADIIRNIRVMLPPPNIAPDLALYGELESFMQILDGVLGAVYNDEVFAGIEGIDSTYPAVIRSWVKSKLVQEYLESHGLRKSINIPNIHDLDLLALIEDRLSMINKVKAIKDSPMMATPVVDNSDDTSSDSNWS